MKRTKELEIYFFALSYVYTKLYLNGLKKEDNTDNRVEFENQIECFQGTLKDFLTDNIPTPTEWVEISLYTKQIGEMLKNITF